MSPADTFQSVTVPAPGWGLAMLRDFARDPIATWRRLAAAGDAVRVGFLGRQVHFLFHPTLLRAALLDDEKALAKESRQLRVFRFAQGENVLTTVGEAWRRQRQSLAPAFAHRAVLGHVDLMRKAAVQLQDHWFPSGDAGVERAFDPAAYASQVTMDVMLRVLFGEPLSRGEADAVTASVQHLAAAGQRMLLWPWLPPETLPFPGRRGVQRHRQALRARLREPIQRRRARRPADGPPKDLLDTMLAAGSLTAQEIEDNALALFLAGHDTSAAALTWWMGFMALHPQHADRARDEVDAVLAPGWADAPLDPATLERLPWLEATLAETLRLRPSAVGTFNRQASKAIDLHGVAIQPGEIVSGSIWQMHHDPRWYPDPERFDPARFLPEAPPLPRGAWLPFGLGPHVCLGQHFAMLEMKLIAALLLSRLRWRFADGEALPAPRVDITLKPARPLRLLAQRR